MKTPSSWDAYLVTDRDFSRGRSTLEIVRAAVKGGVSAIQLREKDLSTRRFYEEGLRIVDVLRSAGVALVINDRIDLVLALEADGVHLGQDDMPLRVAREILGPDYIIGWSVNEPTQIDEEALSLADYLAISPVFFTSTKADITPPWGLEGLREARSLTALPLVAIGGVHHGNARQVTTAGADCVAVVTAIVSADDPTDATRRLVTEVRKGKRQRSGE